jgi:hypothetical protein
MRSMPRTKPDPVPAMRTLNSEQAVSKRVNHRWLLFRTYRQRNKILNEKAMNAEK